LKNGEDGTVPGSFQFLTRREKQGSTK